MRFLPDLTIHALRVALTAAVVLVVADVAAAQPGGPSATTERNCNFGMAKDEPSQSCTIDIPPGCKVAHFPGTDKPWTNISKGGATLCRFDDRKSDYTTKVIGSCGTCRSPQCSARFAVVLDCSQR